ncbi:uncharacterized protein ACBR49_018440 [Aulostomus maculatus]
MHLSYFLLCLGALVKCAAGDEWCYTGCSHTPTHWGDISGSFCGEHRQSPIDVLTNYVEKDPHLQNFTFVNFSSQDAVKSIINTGHTVKCILNDNEVEVSGGGLSGTYSTIQFHFHWGDTEHHPGSEHTVDGHRYPMEMHIVSKKKGLSKEEAFADPEGLAVLGFFIDATEDETESGAWDLLTAYLKNVTDSELAITNAISIDDLIGNVDRTKFYRYMGSLTTPTCNEAVVWTVFQQPINVKKSLVELFPMTSGLTNVYRPTQQLNGRTVYASPATILPSVNSWCYDDHCEFTPSHWHLLPQSHCDGEHQSPINIETEKTTIDEHLGAFNFTKFDDKHAIDYIINTGHTVKCVLKEDTVEVSGGGLDFVYSTVQFHFHWGSASHDSAGSEHTVDSKRYPMEMHIVNKRKDLTVEEAMQAPNGLAVLGFLIEVAATEKSSSSADHETDHEDTNDSSAPASDTDPWKKLTSHLLAINGTGSQAEVTEELSIDDLLGKVDRTRYYRYSGSLTTPSCNEAVVWTVFKESIKLDQSQIMTFPTQVGYNKVYRPVQPLHDRKVHSTSASGAPGPALPSLLLACLCAFLM